MMPRAAGPTDPRAPEAGVTLVEMLVALVLSALVGLAGFAMLDGILRANDRAERVLARVGELDRGMLVLGRDLMRGDIATLRVEGTDIAFARGDGTGQLAYALEDGTLRRRIGAPPTGQNLIDDVASAAWRVVDADRTWHLSWPPEGDDAPTPMGLEVRLTLSDREAHALTRLFELPAALP